MAIVLPSAAVPVVHFSLGTSSTVIGVLGHNISLSVTIENDHPPVSAQQVVWLFQESAVDTGSLQYLISMDGLTLTITGLMDSNEGLYTAMATNEAGVGTVSVLVDVQSELLLSGR